MADYKRFIAYIYLYDKNTRVKNVGFVKVEIRNSQCKLDLHMKGLYTGKEEKANLYLFHRPANAIQVIPIGSFRIINGTADYKGILSFYNVADSGLSMDDISGMIVETEGGRKCATEWDDLPVDFESVYYGEEPENKIEQNLQREETRTIVPDNSGQQAFQPEEAKAEINAAFSGNQNLEKKSRENNAEHINTVEVRAQKETAKAEKDKKIEEAVFHVKGETETIKDVKEAGAVIDIVEADLHKEDKKQNENAHHMEGAFLNIMAKDNKKSDNSKPIREEVKAEIPVKDDEVVKDEEEEIERTTITNPFTAKIKERATDKKAEFLAKMVNDLKEKESSKTAFAEKKNAIDINETEDKFNIEKSKEAGTVKTDEIYKANMSQEEAEEHPNMEELEANRWRQYVDAYPSIHPVEGDEATAYVKIVMKDIGCLAKKEWALMNNSFLIHGYYNYRYLILGKNMQTNECIIGIPGYYHQKEQMMASMFGFPVFRSAKNKDIVQGDFGYWIKNVEI